MDIPKEKRAVMGISIKANRKVLLKETKAGKWTQVYFSEGVCSPNTLKNIEHGRASRFISIYEELSEKLSLKVKYNKDVDITLERLIEKLYVAVEYHDIEKIRYHCNRALDVLKKYNDGIWYCDLYKVIKAVKDYNIKGLLLSSNQFEYYIDLLDEFSYYTCEMIKTLIIISAIETSSSQNFYDLYKLLAIEKSTSAFNEINQLMYLFSLNKTSKFQNQVTLLEKKYNDSENYLRLLDIYNLSITYFSYFDQDEIDTYAEKIDSLVIEKSEIVRAKLYDIYFCLGIAYHKIGRYEDCISYMWKSYEFDVNKVKRMFLFLANSQRRLGLPLKLPQYTPHELKKFPIDEKMMYKYYDLEGKDIPEMFRQKFIMQKVLPNLHASDEFSVGIMREELGELVQRTNQYKDLIIFDIKIRELITIQELNAT